MNAASVANLVQMLPEIRKLAKFVKADGTLVELVKADQKKAAIDEFVNVAFSDIVLASDWPFVQATVEMATVANQSEYEVTGNSSDCRNILNIKYESENAFPLEKISNVRADQRFAGSLTSVLGWTPNGWSNGFPRFKLLGAPTVADIPIFVRYRRKNIGFGEIPDEFQKTFVLCTAAYLQPTYGGEAQEALKQMINIFDPSGGEEDPVIMDAQWRQSNVARSRMHGY